MTYCEAGEKLVAAWRTAEKERMSFLVESQERKGRDAVRAFLRETGIKATSWSVTGYDPAIVLAGDLKVTCKRIDGGDYFSLSGKCPMCGEQAWSKECYNAATLGEQLVQFQPGHEHVKTCPVRNKKEPLPWRERLRLAWRILREGR